MRYPFLIAALLACSACGPIIVERREQPSPGYLVPPPAYPVPPQTDHGPPPDIDRPRADEPPHDGERDRRREAEREEDREQRIDRAIVRAYRDVLEREPDDSGREHYRGLLIQGWTEEQLRAHLRDSVEYRVDLPDAKTTRAYREILGREPDRSGLESYRKKLVDHGWTEQSVEADLRKSAEFRERPVEEMVRRCYREVFERDPDRETLARWARQMKDQGWTMSQLRAHLKPADRNPPRKREGR